MMRIKKHPCIALLFAMLFVQGCDSSKPLEKVIFAEPNQPLVAPVYVAAAKGYFREEALDVTLQRHTSGRDSLKAVLEGLADVCIVAETPIMHAAFKGEPVRVIATVSNSEENMKVIASREEGITRPANLRGKTIASSFGTNGEYYKHVFLRLNGISLSDVKLVNLNPEEMIPALERGDISAFVSWEPHVIRAEQLLKDRAISFSQPGIYTWTFNMAGMQTYVDAHPEVVRKLLRALIKATSFVQQHKEEAMAITAERIGMNLELLKVLWEKYNFEIALDDYLLVSLVNQAKWVERTGYVPRGTPLPEFRSFIYRDALWDVDPEAVSIVADNPLEGSRWNR